MSVLTSRRSIFERIKEEVKGGRPLIHAVRIGFKNAMTAVLDANITTIIAAVVLLALALLWKTPEEKAGKFQDDDRTYRRNDRGPKSGNTKNRK